MSTSLYEEYKDALRRGHVAAVRGRLDVALAAYREAARIVPDRPLPYVGLAGVLARLGRPDEALTAYRAALSRAADDEGALRGMADVLEAEGRPAEAATTLDRLAGVLERADRTADACDVARRALELAESRGRRKLVQTLVTRLRESTDPTAADTLARALSVLEVPGAGEGTARSADETAPDDGSQPSTEADTAADAEAVPGEAPPVPEPPPTPAPAPRAPLPDPIILRRAFEKALDAGKLDEARKHAVAAASAHRAAGQFHASIDACYEALAIAPADPGVHFSLALLYLDRGWRTLAADKLLLIGRLARMTGDTASQARLCDLVVRRFPDDPRLLALCV